MPFVSEAVLLNGSLIQKTPITYEDSYLDAVLQFASNLREKDIFMYGTNMDYFGHLVNPDGFNTSLVRPEMYEIFNNLEVGSCAQVFSPSLPMHHSHVHFRFYRTGPIDTFIQSSTITWTANPKSCK